jgi:curved DNA-binding protein CbpA
VPRATTSTRYQLLLRKHRQLHARVSARELLDLPRDAGADAARRALRRLASSLHPDALGPEAPDSLRARSNELMAALGRAEREVRAGARRAQAR